MSDRLITKFKDLFAFIEVMMQSVSDMSSSLERLRHMFEMKFMDCWTYKKCPKKRREKCFVFINANKSYCWEIAEATCKSENYDNCKYCDYKKIVKEADDEQLPLF